jgi:hypothetical protein
MNQHLNPEQLPLYRKGQEIFELTAKIVDLIPEDATRLAAIKDLMLEDAALLTVKVAGAEAGDLYDIRMENAAIIRKAARDLQTHCASLTMFGYEETHYLHLIRDALEEYRLLYLDWVSGFDQSNYVVDRWGLFNPPGVSPDDPDPDKEL